MVLKKETAVKCILGFRFALFSCFLSRFYNFSGSIQRLFSLCCVFFFDTHPEAESVFWDRESTLLTGRAFLFIKLESSSFEFAKWRSNP